jgi:hypothetical protein
MIAGHRTEIRTRVPSRIFYQSTTTFYRWNRWWWWWRLRSNVYLLLSVYRPAVSSDAFAPRCMKTIMDIIRWEFRSVKSLRRRNQQSQQTSASFRHIYTWRLHRSGWLNSNFRSQVAHLLNCDQSLASLYSYERSGGGCKIWSPGSCFNALSRNLGNAFSLETDFGMLHYTVLRDNQRTRIMS